MTGYLVDDPLWNGTVSDFNIGRYNEMAEKNGVDPVRGTELIKLVPTKTKGEKRCNARRAATRWQ